MRDSFTATPNGSRTLETQHFDEMHGFTQQIPPTRKPVISRRKHLGGTANACLDHRTNFMRRIHRLSLCLIRMRERVSIKTAILLTNYSSKLLERQEPFQSAFRTFLEEAVRPQWYPNCN
ncbi:hypothetical protein RSSM_05297 [Rhodopirellula sallentina SM41]|uniref:Uncharacterized protein n=1 Tax=Rhodopirellula sallentina SM41 TaxID=1263870 RepID=M5TWB2_9BACT|nr:hypothetical protein RSSM_05297 [Rhodopirellula sallentina SM41]